MMGIAKILLAALGILAVFGAMASLFTVEQREQALVLEFGKPVRVIQTPGLYAKIPIFQEAVIFDNRLLDYDAPAEEIIASDQKRLVVDAFARYKIENPLTFYQTVRTEEVLRPRLGAIINSNLRKVLGTVPLQDVISEDRSNLMRLIAESVAEEAAAFGIRVYDVRIKRADLPEGVARPMRAKPVPQQRSRPGPFGWHSDPGQRPARRGTGRPPAPEPRRAHQPPTPATKRDARAVR